MAKEKTDYVLYFWIFLIIAISFASVFKEFLLLTYTFIGGRTTLYIVDTIRLLGIFNILSALFLFKQKKWAFYAVTFITSLMVLLSIFAGRFHASILYLILLIGLVFSVRISVLKKKISTRSVIILTLISLLLVIASLINAIVIDDMSKPYITMVTANLIFLFFIISSLFFSIVNLIQNKKKKFAIIALIISLLFLIFLIIGFVVNGYSFG